MSKREDPSMGMELHQSLQIPNISCSGGGVGIWLSATKQCPDQDGQSSSNPLTTFGGWGEGGGGEPRHAPSG